jgi:hypothetical protein
MAYRYQWLLMQTGNGTNQLLSVIANLAKDRSFHAVKLRIP